MFPRILALILVVLVIISFNSQTHVEAASCSTGQVDCAGDQACLDIQKKLDELNKACQLSANATKPLVGQLDSLKRQLAQIQASLDALVFNIQTKGKELSVREDKLASQQALLETRVRSYYIRSYSTSPLLVLLSTTSPGDLFRELSYRQSATREDRKVISSITTEIQDLMTQKDKLEKDKVRQSALQAQVDQNAQFLGGEIKKAQAYQANLTSQIASLTAQQQSILAQRLASLNIPLYASAGGSCSSDLTNGKDPGFGGGFGLFTYGVPNRVGLSQYGAFGRARAGQSYTQILQAYYNFDSVADVNQGTQIHVSGNGIDWTGSLEDYVKRIYEVPDSWGSEGGMEALKAQAIAARSYVLAYTNSGQGTICPTDQCQVFKTDPKGGNWDSAVSQTAGKVIVQGGSPIKAWFSSTHGGYTHSSSDIGWNGTSWTKNAQDAGANISSFDDLKNNAYDKDSPWFYCDWGSRSSYGGTAWLKPDEIADIANVVLLAAADAGTRNHLYQVDKPNLAGTDTWDGAKVKQELQSRSITPFDSVSSMSVSVDFGSGKTTSVNINNQGFSADLFKTYFNLRAPANIQIVGPLFNVERK
ncbi:MAG: SpoIID/LytB domain-containing protein [Candidatus Daviesbacteria bacterium]|nr:SpoIID/LytB domain-containing protein [Candidatus Daviesbacteria bacterium]